MVSNSVKNTIMQHGLIKQGDSVVLGVSGGPDSLCLLYVLAGLQKDLGFKLYALHLNHKLRGRDADDDMRFVATHCKRLDVPLTLKISDVAALAEKYGTGLEETGRKVRHAALKRKAEQLRKLKAEAGEEGNVSIALAHNKDDQAETVLMRIIRGTGVHGLAAMDYQRKDGVIRPLLDVSRKEIEEYLKEAGLKARIDKSNGDTNFTRNRIRLDLLPKIEKEYNPSFKDCLVRLASSAREDDKYISSVASTIIKTHGQQLEDLEENISMELLCRMEPAVAKRVIKEAFVSIGLTEDIEAVHINKLLDAFHKKVQSGIYEFPRGYRVSIDYGRVRFLTPVRECKQYLEYRVLFREELPQELEDNCVLLDASVLADMNADLELRYRKAGDIVRPVGMEGSKKLSDYLIDNKIPKDKRDNMLCLCCGKEVLWIPGRYISRLVKATDDTRIFMLAELKE